MPGWRNDKFIWVIRKRIFFHKIWHSVAGALYVTLGDREKLQTSVAQDRNRQTTHRLMLGKLLISVTAIKGIKGNGTLSNQPTSCVFGCFSAFDPP